jgi:hypothetical protein
MAVNAALLVGWTRPVPGREAETQSKFQEYVGFLGKLQQSGQIESAEPFLPLPHGGDLNGFFILRGDRAKLQQLRDNEQWKDWAAWGQYHLMGFGIVECHAGDAVKDQIGRLSKFTKH